MKMYEKMELNGRKNRSGRKKETKNDGNNNR